MHGCLVQKSWALQAGIDQTVQDRRNSAGRRASLIHAALTALRVSDYRVRDHRVRRSSFCVRHRLFNKGKLAVECIEIRVWAALSEGDPDKIESKPIPPDVIMMFSGGATRTGRKSVARRGISRRVR